MSLQKALEKKVKMQLAAAVSRVVKKERANEELRHKSQKISKRLSVK